MSSISAIDDQALRRWSMAIDNVIPKVTDDLLRGDLQDGRRLHQRFRLYFAQTACARLNGDFALARSYLYESVSTYTALLDAWESGSISNKYVYGNELEPVLAALVACDWSIVMQVAKRCARRPNTTHSISEFLSALLTGGMKSDFESEAHNGNQPYGHNCAHLSRLASASLTGLCCDIEAEWLGAVSEERSQIIADGGSGTPDALLLIQSLGLLALHRHTVPSCSCSLPAESHPSLGLLK